MTDPSPMVVGVTPSPLLDDLSVLLPAVASVAAVTALPFPALEFVSMEASVVAAAAASPAVA